MIDILNIVAPKGVREHRDQARAPHDSWGFKAPVSWSDDLRRVLALPRRVRELDGTPRAEALIELMTSRYRRTDGMPCRCAAIDPDRHREDGCITRLRLVQALALREAAICGGLFAPIGVGHGKTLVDLLAPWALQTHGAELIVLLVPPRLAGQLVGDYRFIGQHFRVPKIVIHGAVGYANTGATPDPLVPTEVNAPVVHVVPYSQLRLPKHSAWFEHTLKPQAIIADECHKLRDTKTATGARVERYMDGHPDTMFVGLSGSITARKLRDMDHLARWALRRNSPLPLVEEVTLDWGRAIDAGDNPADPGPLMELCAPGERLLDGFRRRLAETIGVVTTSAPPVDVELEILERPAPPLPMAVKIALDGIPGDPDHIGIRNFVRPDGEELMDALAVAACARQAACGFYYKWIFPHNEFPRDTELVGEWREARKEYHREVRQKLKEREEHLDSPLLCQYAAERAHGERPRNKGLPVWMSRCWGRWRRVKDRVRPETKTVWIDDYLVHDAVQWSRENVGIIWYEHESFGLRVAQLGNLSMYAGGKNGGGLTDDHGNILEKGNASIVLSIKAHGTGVNGLQRLFADQLIPLLPPNQGAEQLLGRLHRIGQKKPRVRTQFYMHTDELADHVTKQLQAALYVEGTLGSQQKLRIGFKLE